MKGLKTLTALKGRAASLALLIAFSAMLILGACTPVKEPVTPPENSGTVILVQPKDVSVKEGEEIRFLVEADSDLVLHYEWSIEKDGYGDTFDIDSPELHLTDSADIVHHDGAKVWCRLLTVDGFVDTRKASIGVAPKSGVNPNPGSADGRHPSVRALEYELATLIGNLPRSDAVDGIWAILRGYWTATDNLFVCFDIQEGQAGIKYGVWESGGSQFGYYAGAKPTGECSAELAIHFPATEGDAMDDPSPARDVSVFIDMAGLDNDGKIRIRILNHGNGEWYTYAYGGATSQEAYDSVH